MRKTNYLWPFFKIKEYNHMALVRTSDLRQTTNRHPHASTESLFSNFFQIFEIRKVPSSFYVGFTKSLQEITFVGVYTYTMMDFQQTVTAIQRTSFGRTMRFQIKGKPQKASFSLDSRKILLD